MKWMLMPLVRFADFRGRSRRREYWMFALGYVLTLVLALIVIGATRYEPGDPSPLSGILAFILAIAILVSIVPSLAIQVRRFHDQDKSGWLVLINLIPYVGSLIVLVFMCLPGTRGANRYGPDPKEDYAKIFS